MRGASVTPDAAGNAGSGSTLLVLCALVVLWASAFPIIKVALEGLEPSHLTLARHLVASAAFVPFLLLTRQRMLPARRDLLSFLGLGVVGMTAYHLGLNYGEVHVSAGATSLIVSAAPALTALVAWWLAGERMGSLGWLGSLVAFGGVALIAAGDGSLAGTAGLKPEALAVFVAPVATAFFAVLQRRMLKRYSPLEVTAYVTWGGTLPLLVFLPGMAAALPGAAGSALLCVLYLGIGPSAIAYTLFATALSRVSAPAVMSFLYLIPVVALGMSWWLLGETPSLMMLLGGVVTVAGLIVIRRSKSLAARRAALGAAAARVVGQGSATC